MSRSCSITTWRSRCFGRRSILIFLYNTLESISAGAYLKGEKELAYMAVLLGRSLRYSISQPDDTVTVRQELDELHDYMELQKNPL